MRFVHAVVSLRPSAGVLAQLDDEARSAADLGLDWTILIRHGAASVGRTTERSVLDYLQLRLGFYRELVRRGRRGEVVVLRHSAGDPLQFIATLFLRRRYATVHHTLEEPELRAFGTLASRLQLVFERTLGRSVVRRAAAVVAATPEIAQYQSSRAGTTRTKPLIVYPNGIRMAVRERLCDSRSDRPELLFVADYFYRWHGLEELLGSLEKSEVDGILHVVGVLPPTLVRIADHRVVYHGPLSQVQIRTLYASTWLGLSSFRLDVKGMTQACTLKVRDYLAAGIPVLAGHEDSGLPSNFPYFAHGTCDWSKAVATAHKFRATARADVVNAARIHIDKTFLLKRLHSQLVSALNTEPGAS
jgi:hypothetical protein